MAGLTYSTSLKALAHLGSSKAWLFHQATSLTSVEVPLLAAMYVGISDFSHVIQKLKAHCLPILLFLDKINSPFCLQNCSFLLTAHFAQSWLSKFCQGLMTVHHIQYHSTPQLPSVYKHSKGRVGSRYLFCLFDIMSPILASLGFAGLLKVSLAKNS